MGPYGKGTDTNVIKYDERIHGSIEEEDYFLKNFERPLERNGIELNLKKVGG